MTVLANWANFSGIRECFSARMALLERLSGTFPHYGEALRAGTGEQYVLDVSKSWSTDPGRAGKVLAIYDSHAVELQRNGRAA